MGLLGRLRVDVLANSAQFRKEMAGVQKRMKAVGKSLTSVGKGLTLGVTAPIVAVGAAAVKLAADSAEAAAKFETVFGGAADAVNVSRWIQEHATRRVPGHHGRHCRACLPGIQDLLVPLGLAPDAAQRDDGPGGQAVLATWRASIRGSISPIETALLRVLRSGLVGQSIGRCSTSGWRLTHSDRRSRRPYELGLVFRHPEHWTRAARAQATFIAHGARRY